MCCPVKRKAQAGGLPTWNYTKEKGTAHSRKGAQLEPSEALGTTGGARWPASFVADTEHGSAERRQVRGTHGKEEVECRM